MENDNLGNRMKTYENVTRTYLTRRTPVIIRIDGKAFRSFTKGFEKPFDKVMVKAMQETMKLFQKISVSLTASVYFLPLIRQQFL